MLCARCHWDNGPSATFCAQCGARLAGRCRACSAEVAADARYCSSCGSPLPFALTSTHLAARMEQLAAPGSILTTADTVRLAKPFVQVHALGPTSVKGFRHPLEIFEVVGASPLRNRMQALAADTLSPFSYASHVLFVAGDYDGSIASGRRGLLLATAADELGAQVVANNYLGLASFYRGDYRQAVEYLRWNIGALTASSPVSVSASAVCPPSSVGRRWPGPTLSSANSPRASRAARKVCR